MTQRTIGGNIRRLTFVIALAFLLTSTGVGYWSLVAAARLNADPFNPRLIAAVRDRPRGKIVDASGRVLAESAKDGDSYRRRYSDRSLAQVIGYASFKYGASGIEGAYQESLIGQDPSDLLGQWKVRYLGARTEPGSACTPRYRARHWPTRSAGSCPMSDSWYAASTPDAPYLKDAYPMTCASDRSGYWRR